MPNIQYLDQTDNNGHLVNQSPDSINLYGRLRAASAALLGATILWGLGSSAQFRMDRPRFGRPPELTYPIHRQMVQLGTMALNSRYGNSVSIDFGPCGGMNAGRMVSAVQLQITQADVEIDSLVIQFGNGETESIPVQYYYPINSVSHIIDLPGFNRCVRRAYLSGRTLGYGQVGLVTLYGLRGHVAPQPVPPPRPWPPQPVPPAQPPYPNPSPGRAILGSVRFGQASSIQEVYVSDCRWRPVFVSQLQLKIGPFAPVFIQGAEIHLGSGQRIQVNIGTTYAPNSWSPVRSLPGNTSQCVSKVLLMGQSMGNGPADVQVLGFN